MQVFQLMTLMSQSEATKDIYGRCCVALRSQSLMVLSQEHEARTYCCMGDHWTSSIESVCPYSPTCVSLMNALQVSSEGVYRFKCALHEPDASLPKESGDQSSAYPSTLCLKAEILVPPNDFCCFFYYLV